MPWRPKDEMLHPVEGRFLVQRVGSTCPCRRSTFRSLEMAQQIQGRVGRKVQFLLEGFFGFLDLSLYQRELAELGSFDHHNFLNHRVAPSLV